MKPTDMTSKQTFQELYETIFENGTMIYAGTLLARAAKQFPLHSALEYENDCITYQQLYRESVAISVELIARGVNPGDRVIIIVENSIDFYRAYYGAWQTGAVVAPLNTFLKDSELLHIINDAQPSMIMVSDTFYERLHKTDLTKDRVMPAIFSPHDIKICINKAAHEYDSLAHFIPRSQPADEAAALLYTSGTTGFPKGVMLSSRNILTNLIQGLCLLKVSTSDKVLAALPLFHSFAQSSCVWASFFVGGTTIIVPRIERRALSEGLAHKPTFIVGVPALFGLFCLMKNVSFDTVKYFICGGDALPDKIRIGFELLYRRRLANGYGLTEAAPLIAVNFDDALLQPNTVGRLAHGITARLCDEAGNEVARGQKGILWVKGDNIMLGYYKAVEETAKVLRDGWLDTGDWAFFDACDRLVIAGRHKDLIVHKGFNIYPPEIENVLFSHMAIIQAAVVGKKDDDVGEYPVAFVVCKEGLTVTIEELKELCQKHLASYKVPRTFYIVEAAVLPLNPLKKVDKKRLRQMVVEDQAFSK